MHISPWCKLYRPFLCLQSVIIGAVSQKKLSLEFPTISDTNQAVQLQKLTRDLKFLIQEEEELYYLCSENKGADQLHGYLEADMRLCLRMCKRQVFS